MKRAKELVLAGNELAASKSFSYFLKQEVDEDNFTSDTLHTFAKLDDYDVLAAIKEWIFNDDIVLSKLSESLINRRLPKVELQNSPFTEKYLDSISMGTKEVLKLSDIETTYFVYHGKIFNQAYDATKNNIKILNKDGNIKDIIEASDHLNIRALSNPIYKYYICYPKK